VEAKSPPAKKPGGLQWKAWLMEGLMQGGCMV
jgi:hypothetical protein